MKKILILTAGFGEGHNSAARGIRDGLLQIAPDTRAEIRDLFAETFGPLNEIARRLYLTVINRAPRSWAATYRWIDRRQNFRPGLSTLFLARARLAAVVARERPDLIASVYPAYGYFLEEILGPATGEKPRRVICITDSISINAIWYRASADYFLLANEHSADVLVRAGVDRAVLRVTGFPVSPKFAALTPRAARPPWRLLCMINAGNVSAPDLVRQLAAIPNTQLTVTVGRDEKLRREVERVRGAHSFEIIGWTDELPQLLGTHHLLISKAGGATVQETISACCPMIINQVVPGQEEGNAQLITMTNCGRVALSNDDVLRAVDDALRDDGKLLCDWSANVARISRPAAALEIAGFLLSLSM